jgi:uncharacterized protein (DUF433 family)
MHMNETPLDRIVVNPAVMVGKPVVRGTRLTVELILELLGQGCSVEEVLEYHPNLSVEDIRACLLFASRSLAEETFVPLTPGS